MPKPSAQNPPAMALKRRRAEGDKDEPVKLNVGGKRFDVSLQTLNAFGYLRARLDGGFALETDECGCVFVDRDPALFEILLQSVRTLSRPPQHEVDARKQSLLAECAFYCVDSWLVESIMGRIAGFFMRHEDRAIRFAERTNDAELLDPFRATFEYRPTTDLGPALLQPESDDERPRVDCENATALKDRLNALTRGLVDEVAGTSGLLIAGGSVVDALTGNHRRCTDVDVFLRCAPAEGMAKLRSVYEACGRVARSMSHGGSLKNMLVTRTTFSVTILISCDRACPPIQVPWAGHLGPMEGVGAPVSSKIGSRMRNL